MRNSAKTEFARHLRKRMTEAETRLWFHLRCNRIGGFRFRKQHPVGPYIADFACIEARLIVEIDGSQHGSPDDNRRDDWLRENGFRILRFWNNDALNRTYDVLAVILDALTSSLLPSACGNPSMERSPFGIHASPSRGLRAARDPASGGSEKQPCFHYSER
jgi:very-short-patch-repair endonuclease